MFKKPIYFIALAFVLLIACYFLFSPSVNLSNATVVKSKTTQLRNKKKNCSCCDRLKRFTKEFEEKYAETGSEINQTN